MKTIFILASLLLLTPSASMAAKSGLAFICSNPDADFKITADLSEGDKAIVVVDEGYPRTYRENERVEKKNLFGRVKNFVLARKHFFKVNWNPKAKSLIEVKDTKNKSVISLTTDPDNNHSAVTIEREGFKQTQIDAILSTPGQEIKEQPVSCLVLEWKE